MDAHSKSELLHKLSTTPKINWVRPTSCLKKKHQLILMRKNTSQTERTSVNTTVKIFLLFETTCMICITIMPLLTSLTNFWIKGLFNLTYPPFRPILGIIWGLVWEWPSGLRSFIWITRRPDPNKYWDYVFYYYSKGKARIKKSLT